MLRDRDRLPAAPALGSGLSFVYAAVTLEAFLGDINKS